MRKSRSPIAPPPSGVFGLRSSGGTSGGILTMCSLLAGVPAIGNFEPYLMADAIRPDSAANDPARLASNSPKLIHLPVAPHDTWMTKPRTRLPTVAQLIASARAVASDTEPASAADRAAYTMRPAAIAGVAKDATWEPAVRMEDGSASPQERRRRPRLNGSSLGAWRRAGCVWGEAEDGRDQHVIHASRTLICSKKRPG